LIDKSRLISIKIRQKVLSLLEGKHRIIKFGEEDDLKNIREYTYGDNVKRINWIITAKEKKPYVVEREELKSQNIVICLFVDQEFLFKNKLEKMAEVYSIIAYSAMYQKDRLYTYIFSSGVEMEVIHRNNISTVQQVLDHLFKIKLKEKRLNFENFHRKVLSHRRSLLVLIGDFFYDIDLIPVTSKHKPVIIKIRDRDEENPEKYTGYQLRSFDGKRKIPYLVPPMVKTYKKNLSEIDEKLRQFAVLNRIPIRTIYTDEDPFVKLRLLFS